jgi:hypothetical protein
LYNLVASSNLSGFDLIPSLCIFQMTFSSSFIN